MSRICGPIKKKELLVALLKPEGPTLFLARRIYYRWVFLKYLFFPFTRQQNVILLELRLVPAAHRLYYRNIRCDIKNESR